MSSEDPRNRSERQSFFEDVVEFLQKSVRWEHLKFLLEDKPWENFVTKVNLSREEANVLREHLIKLLTDLAGEDPGRLQKYQQEKERFLKEFPQVKQKLKESIKKLRELADHVDKVHRDCTISNVVASSTGIASGTLSILGLILAPFTGGLSLGLSAAGIGLGAASAVTGVSTMVVEKVNTSSAETQASLLDTAEIISYVIDLYHVKDLGMYIHAIRVANDNPELEATEPLLSRLITTRQVSVQSDEQVRPFEGTPLAATRTARIASGVTSGLFLALNVYSLVKEVQDLQEGAKTASAENMRQKAQELEKKLEELTWVYESLQ
ncbi:apolipoprotein L3-like [Cervus elaphus]|uniref:apolipoprotein L3-like n=1 Tax=Cervus elaphus TaxID=9860 RepID=UPI001CC2B220|nr:apolipoprotein L3-like [Cervus elaphus]XP_043736975.1 apolipoprotein L3-like [Cervus elaphus]XP_043736976.1 apolipoprotein L3-like [Cervus elaphus]XP_043736977.1 apolipoprotein L3-like [Cervus elaphus]XP_043736978.1 apolipoprotein L3-like [Cervus elaphus]XP_043736979.1 apolipoprotein L3-like [Cervus elaphus]XP_043736980.1 apolipoprotein L3-like [Cervus elaphus]XP_043736981.1 apolipoprotein L3-like [Cervus elaphus]